MKKISIVLVMFITSLVLNAQHADKHGDIKDEIKFQLKILEDESISKLRHRDKEEALKRIDAIYELLDQIELRDETRREKHEKHVEPPVYVLYPMEENAFNSLLSTIDKEMMPSDKIRIINLSAPVNFFSMDQLIAVIKKFNFDDDRMLVVEKVYPRLINIENSHLLFNYFTFSSSKEKLEEIIKNTPVK